MLLRPIGRNGVWAPAAAMTTKCFFSMPKADGYGGDLRPKVKVEKAPSDMPRRLTVNGGNSSRVARMVGFTFWTLRQEMSFGRFERTIPFTPSPWSQMTRLILVRRTNTFTF